MITFRRLPLAVIAFGPLLSVLTFPFHRTDAGAFRQNAAKPEAAALARIIESFTANELKLQREIGRYRCRREIRAETLDRNNRSNGSLHRISEISWTANGDLQEIIRQFPASSLQGLTFTAADFTDLDPRRMFPVTAENRAEYHIDYRKRERIDEIDAYVFFIEPKRVPAFSPNAKRYFSGQVWVDERDLQIVKTEGKFLPEDSANRMPKTETYRENINGSFWFPTYAYADDTLRFQSGDIHLRLKVRYRDYQRADRN
jgi:hypothetical protein